MDPPLSSPPPLAPWAVSVSPHARWLYTSVVWHAGSGGDGPRHHVCGRAAAGAYIQHLLAPQVLAVPVCGIAGVSRVVIHRDGDGEWCAGLGRDRSLGAREHERQQLCRPLRPPRPRPIAPGSQPEALHEHPSGRGTPPGSRRQRPGDPVVPRTGGRLLAVLRSVWGGVPVQSATGVSPPPWG